MAYQKLQVSRGTEVIPSDTIDIPNPSLDEVASGSITTTGDIGNLDRLTDSSGNFEAEGGSVAEVL